jgi:hypothetical protein
MSDPTMLTKADLVDAGQDHRQTSIQELQVDHDQQAHFAELRQTDMLQLVNRIPPRPQHPGPMRPVFDTTAEVRARYVSNQQADDGLSYLKRRTTDSRSDRYHQFKTKESTSGHTFQ